MTDWLQKLHQEWPLIRSAPYSAISVLVVLLLVLVPLIWGIVSYSYSTGLFNKNAQLDLLRDRVAAYESKLKTTSPEQAADELKSLKDRLAETQQQLEKAKNPPRESNTLYQGGVAIGTVTFFKIDTGTKRLTFDRAALSNSLETTTNVEFRNLVLAYVSHGSAIEVGQGDRAMTQYMGLVFSIVGNRPD
jgi:hypothetical protein